MSGTLHSKLVAAQKELKAPKGNFNSFGKYKYRSAEDILEAVKPVNAQNGLLLTLSDEPIFIGDWHYIKATATISDGENSVAVTAYARESLSKKGMDDSQITGTASSYARKYALNGLYLIDDTKDADTDEYQNQGNSSQQKDQTTETLTIKFSEAYKLVGGAPELYKKLDTNKDKLSKLIKSNNKKDKESVIKQLEVIINDYANAG